MTHRSKKLSADHGRRVALTALLRFRRMLLATFVAAGLILLLDAFVIESVVVPSKSMIPTLLPNERAFLIKHPLAQIHRFDVVVIHASKMHDRLVKRVIALPGERIQVAEDYRVSIDGHELIYGDENDDGVRTESPNHCIRTKRDGPPAAPSFRETDVLLGPDEYFVLGDNRLASADSRVFGPVRRADIEGRVGLVWYSYDLVGRVLRRDRLFTTVH